MNSRKLSGIIALVVVLCGLAAARVTFGSVADYYLEIKGEKQGQFKGEGSGGLTGRIFGSQFSYHAVSVKEPASGQATGREAQTGKATGNAVAAPRDVATGQMSGKRQHSDISIVKYTGDSSRMFATAMSTGEVLTSVDISFFHGTDAKPDVYRTVHMTNVMITAIKPMPSSSGDNPMESITFTAETQNIVAKDKNGNKTAMDDWSK